MTAIDRNSKPDTSFLSLPAGAGAAAMADDLSQYRTSLAVTGSRAAESPSTRTGLTTTREISIVVDLISSDNAVILSHGDGGTANNTYYVRVNMGQAIFAENGSIRATIPLPAVTGSTRTFLLHWSTRPDGAASRSEFYLHNLTTGASSFTTTSHAAATTDPSYGLHVNGSSLVGGLATAARWRALRIGRRFHSVAEAHEDWVAQTTPPATTQVRRDAVLVPDRSTLDIASDGSFAGPAYLWSGHAFEHSDRRLVGPLVNVRVPSPLEIDADFDAPVAGWWRAAPGDSAYKIAVTHLWRRPVPGKVNRARVRLFVRQEDSSDTETAEVRYRAYSMAGLPVVGQPVGPLTYHRTAAGTCTTDHPDDGVSGEWLDLGALPLAVDDRGFTWLAIAVDFDDEDELAATTTAQILAATFDPYFEPAEGGALDILEP